MIFSITIVIASFLIGIYLYPQMPDQMASHWNIRGEVDGYGPKTVALFVMPVISVVLLLMFSILPKIDPHKENIKKIAPLFAKFITGVILFLFYIYIVTLAWNLGYRFSIGTFLAPALGLLFIGAGRLIEKAEPNWFVGIRTPWTLSNDKVWKKTHALGGKLFYATGVLAIVGAFFPAFSFWLVIIPIIGVILFLFGFSYWEYHKLT